MRFEEAEVMTVGVAGFSPVALQEAAVLDEGEIAERIDREEVNRLLRAPIRQLLAADEGVPAPWVQARRLLHHVLAHPAPVRHVSQQLDVCPETLSRRFSRAYGLSAKQYCHKARLFEAVLRIISGATIVESAFTAGFCDLKRFYQQFRRILGTTPGEYSRVKKRQDLRDGSPV